MVEPCQGRKGLVTHVSVEDTLGEAVGGLGVQKRSAFLPFPARSSLLRRVATVPHARCRTASTFSPAKRQMLRRRREGRRQRRSILPNGAWLPSDSQPIIESSSVDAVPSGTHLVTGELPNDDGLVARRGQDHVRVLSRGGNGGDPAQTHFSPACVPLSG